MRPPLDGTATVVRWIASGCACLLLAGPCLAAAAKSNPESASKPSPALSAPSFLAAIPVGPSEIDLLWPPPVKRIGAVDDYWVYRNGKLIGKTRLLTFSDRKVSPGKTYTYRVRACGADGKSSAASTPATATLPPNS